MVIGCLHDPANFQQTSSISTCILNTFAGRLLDRVNTPLVLPSRHPAKYNKSATGGKKWRLGNYNVGCATSD